MPKILILDANSSAGLESLQSLGRAGSVVHVASTSPDCLAFQSRYPAARLAQPSVPGDLLPWLTARDADEHYNLILPSTEKSLLVFASADCPQALRVKAVLPSSEALLLATNKESVWQLAQRFGIPVPQSIIASAVSIPRLPFNFPVAVKPIHSKQVAGSRILDQRVAYARDEGVLREILAASPSSSFQVQKLVRGRGVGIELLFVNGNPVRHFAHERVHELPLTGGGSSYRRSIAAPAELLAHSIALLKALGWHGVAMVEWKVDPQAGAALIEINPRLWGSLALAIDAGVDFPRDLLSVALGQTLPLQKPFRLNYYTRDLIRDLDWQITNFRANHADPQLLTRPRLASLLELLRPLLGGESWDFFDRSDLKPTTSGITTYIGKKWNSFTSKIRRRLRSRTFVRATHPAVVGRLAANPAPIKDLLFLCYGNICRSPAAELAARNLLAKHTVSSAGFHETVHRSSPAHLQHAAAKFGLDLAAHRSRKAAANDIDRADLILVMDWKNYDQLLRTFPQAAGKATFLGLFSDAPTLEIEDPYDLRGEKVDRVLRQIDSSVKGLAARLHA